MNVVSISEHLTNHNKEHAAGLAAYFLVKTLVELLVNERIIPAPTVKELIASISESFADMEAKADSDTQKEVYQTAKLLVEHITTQL